MTVAISSFKAQHGEDRLLATCFGHKPHGYFVEVGAYDGVNMSNSYYFEQIGWTGLLIEADPDLADQCAGSRPASITVNCAVVPPGMPLTTTFRVVEGVEGWEIIKGLSSLSLSESVIKKHAHLVKGSREISVPAKTLDTILEENNASAIDFVTIDVEGHEWGVLQGFTLSRWKPQVVLIERNSHLPDMKLMRHMHGNHYIFCRTTGGVNDWFERVQPGVSSSPAYLGRLWLSFYLPKYLTAWLPPIREFTKRLYRACRPR